MRSCRLPVQSMPQKGHNTGAKFCNAEAEVYCSSCKRRRVGWWYTVACSPFSAWGARCQVSILDEIVPFIFDTCVCSIIIGVDQYNKLKSKLTITLKNVSDDEKLLGYGSKSKLDLLGSFIAKIQCEDNNVHAVFYVYNGEATCFLSHETAVKLSLVSYSDNVVCNVLPENSDKIVKSFPNFLMV